MILKSNIEVKPIIIQQNTSIISSGTTGLHVWPACFQLIEYLTNNKKILENKLAIDCKFFAEKYYDNQ